MSSVSEFGVPKINTSPPLPDRMKPNTLSRRGTDMPTDEERVPSVTKTAFACPHCGAYTTQTWHDTFGKRYSGDERTPSFPDPGSKTRVLAEPKFDDEFKAKFAEWCDNIESGKPFIEKLAEPAYPPLRLSNVFVTECYNCSDLAIWVHHALIYPNTKVDIQPNQDMNHRIIALFDEAREIVGPSPKGAAAILRLCVQHLCRDLGESGTNIDSDIASLVSKGLNPVVQQSLDIVRVIGNESVHPGEIDLNDHRDTALKLFELVNLIADQMISHPKKVGSLYQKLPEGKRKAIEARNAKATGQGTP
jgi:hypothetical protein